MSHGRFTLFAASLAIAGAIIPATADAQYRGRDRYQAQRGSDASGGYEAQRGDARRADRGRGYEAQRPGIYQNEGRRGGVQRRCDKGTGGTILGAIAGGLLGNSVAGRGDRGTGAVLGAGVGALAGRAIDRDC